MIITICIVLRFLSTLSLRRATFKVLVKSHGNNNFYPRSPYGERPILKVYGYGDNKFLSTLSLRRATVVKMSIKFFNTDFYPRSPYGERHPHELATYCRRYFYPRSPYGERQFACAGWFQVVYYFYPRSPYGERPCQSGEAAPHKHFYPRSPYGERLSALHHIFKLFTISIHALLTESDRERQPVGVLYHYFYPRSPYGERLNNPPSSYTESIFLSTLSLRRATNKVPNQGKID